MRRQAASLWSSSSRLSQCCRHERASIEAIGRRYVRISATPTSWAPGGAEVDVSAVDAGRTPDAKFEVIGTPSSMLSVSLSPSQDLYTRRGTLVAVSGKPENAISTLSVLSPLTRLPLGIPFLYQRVSSSTPLSALIASRSSNTSFTAVHLDGRLDWMIAQRSALLAWTGHTLSVKPRMNTRLGFQNWGNTFVSGRGVLALVGKGQIYQVSIKEGEDYVVHPSHVVAYTMNGIPPEPFRFRSSTLRLQVPSISSLLPDTRFFNEMKKSQLWNFLAKSLFRIRTWATRTIWGDRLFLSFKGPTTVLLQSRGSRITDSLSAEEVNEIADAPAGAVRRAIRGDGGSQSASTTKDRQPLMSEKDDKREEMRKEGTDDAPASMQEAFQVQRDEMTGRKPAAVRWATVSKGGKVDFSESGKKP